MSDNLPNAYALLKFNVSSIPGGQTIQSAVLHLYQFGGAGSGDHPTALYYYADNSWADNAFTWGNMTSGAYEKVISYCNDGQTHIGESTWSFAWDSSWGNTISLIMAEYSTGVQSHNWYSKEYSELALRPYLEIATTAVPISAAVWLLGSGLIGLIGVRKFRK